MRVQAGWLWILVVVVVLLGGCSDDGGTAGSAGGAAGVGGTAGTNGTGGVGGGLAPTCSPDSLCETDGLLCHLAEGRCVECLSTANCAGDMQSCVDGTCRERLCMEDNECPPGMPECTDIGCAPCVGEVAPDDERGDCFDARGPDGESPRKDKPDGCSAQQFVAALENAGYDIPTDAEARQAIADNPVKRVSEGLCTVPFGNAGDFVSACELHDYCYAVCGSTRAQCDLEFRSRLLETCAATYGVGPCRATCDVVALIYAGAVADAPELGYVAAQGRNCQCCPDLATDGTCDEDVGESVANSLDCKGDFPNGTSCLLDIDCDSDYCSVHGECTPSSCLANGDCPSGICNWGVCLARTLEEGSGCTTSEACTSDVCTLGVCRECDRDDQCAASKHCNLFGDCIDVSRQQRGVHGQRRMPVQHLFRGLLRGVRSRRSMRGEQALQPLRRLHRRSRQQRGVHGQRRMPVQHLFRGLLRGVRSRRSMRGEQALQPLRRLHQRSRPWQSVHCKRRVHLRNVHRRVLVAGEGDPSPRGIRYCLMQRISCRTPPGVAGDGLSTLTVPRRSKSRGHEITNRERGDAGKCRRLLVVGWNCCE